MSLNAQSTATPSVAFISLLNIIHFYDLNAFHVQEGLTSNAQQLIRPLD